MKKTSLGWLALLVISLMAIIYQSTDKSHELIVASTDQHASHAAAGIFTWNADQVSSIRVSRTDSKEMLLKRSALQEWTVNHSVDADLWKAFDVNVFLGTLSRAKEERQYGKVGDGSQYGFVHAVVLSLNGLDATHPVAEIHIGDLAPDGLSRYVFVTGKDQIISIPNYHVKELLRLFSSLGA